MKKRISYLLLALTGLVFFACKKNSGGGTPVITHVRSLDSTTRDSFFVSAVPGNEIVIQGSNLQGATAVYFNDTSAAFNPVYNTSSTIIVVIPATAPTAAINPNVPSTLKVVTSHGSVTTTFTLYNPPPYISSLAFDNTGTIGYINGGNFQGVYKITFPGNDTALGYTVNKAYNQIAVIIPNGSGISDSVRVYCHYGVASFPFPPPMTISSISNENAIPGDTLVIYGTNFVRINNITFPGGVVQTNVTTVDVGQLRVVVPPGITTSDTLRINGILGSVGTSQLFDSYITHPSPGYLSTFEKQGNAGDVDNTSFLGWTGTYVTAPSTTYPQSSGNFAYLTNATAIPAQSRPASQGNPGFIQLLDLPWVANTSTPIAGYNLKFEVYVAKPWSVGQIWIFMGDWYGWNYYMARYSPEDTAAGGTYQPHGWTTVTMPLTNFVANTGPNVAVLDYGTPYGPNTPKGGNTDPNEWNYSTFPTGGPTATKFSDFKSTAICFAITNDGSTSLDAGALNVAIDNVRIVKGK